MNNFFCKIKYQVPFSKYLKVGISYRANGMLTMKNASEDAPV